MQNFFDWFCKQFQRFQQPADAPPNSLFHFLQHKANAGTRPGKIQHRSQCGSQKHKQTKCPAPDLLHHKKQHRKQNSAEEQIKHLRQNSPPALLSQDIKEIIDETDSDSGSHRGDCLCQLQSNRKFHCPSLKQPTEQAAAGLHFLFILQFSDYSLNVHLTGVDT